MIETGTERRFGLRQALEDAVHGLMARVIVEAPEIWSANMIGFISLGTAGTKGTP